MLRENWLGAQDKQQQQCPHDLSFLSVQISVTCVYQWYGLAFPITAITRDGGDHGD